MDLGSGRHDPIAERFEDGHRFPSEVAKQDGVLLGERLLSVEKPLAGRYVALLLVPVASRVDGWSENAVAYLAPSRFRTMLARAGSSAPVAISTASPGPSAGGSVSG
jgi:hypothetical protein